MGALFLSDAAAGGLDTFITAIKTALADFSTTSLSTILVSALGVTVGLALAWFAYRWVVKKVSGAMKRGKI